MDNLIEIIIFVGALISFITAFISLREAKQAKKDIKEIHIEINHIKEVIDNRKVNQETLGENSKNIYSEGNMEIGRDIR